MENTVNPPQLTQKELFKKKFSEIKKDITKEDRVNCAKEVKKSKSTIDKYINGNVLDNSTAFKILTFLTGEIEKRNKILR